MNVWKQKIKKSHENTRENGKDWDLVKAEEFVATS